MSIDAIRTPALASACAIAIAVLVTWRPTAAQDGASPAASAPAPAAPARAPAPAPTDTPPDALLDQAAVVADARTLTAEKFPDADIVLAAEHQRTTYAPDGSHVVLDDEYLKVLTEAGRTSARERALGFNADYGGAELLAVEVIKPDGKVLSLDPAAVSEEQVDRSGMEMNIYDPSERILNIAVPGLEVGDLLHVYTRTWESRPRMKGAFADICLLELPYPIRKVTYEYVCPKERPLRSKALLSEIKGTVAASERTDGDTVVCSWTGTDIPQIFAESMMPELDTVAQRLRVSTLADWREVSRWYWNLTAPHLQAVTPAMKAKAAELSKGLATDEERIRAIFKFVSQEVRYMGITTETEAPGYEPHDVNITFENRYGVCRDKAALLVSMLSAAGIPSFPVLISFGDKLDPEVPSCFFNHAITAARTADGKYVLMDSTDESTADLLPQYLQDKSYIVATPEGETLLTSPVAAASENMLTARTAVRLADDGSATGRTEIAFEGINDNSYRGMFVQMKPADIRRGLESAVKSSIPGGTLTSMSLTPTDMKDGSEKIRLTLEWNSPGLLVAGGEAAQLDLPFVGYGFGVAARTLGAGLELEKRRFPLDLDQPCGVHEDLEITLPAGLGAPIALPAYENTEHADFSTVQRISAAPGRLEASIDLRVKSPRLAPDQYPVLKRAMAAMEANGRQQPVFARSAGAAPPPRPTADIEVERASTVVRMDAPDRWSTRRELRQKVLTPAGIKSASELKLNYNPAWQTVEVEYARVTQKDGTVKTVQPQEMNVMDAEWAASAPRYPAGKTLVVSLPGVEVGSTIEYALRETQKDQPLFSSAYAFSSGERIDEVALTYDLPEGVSPKLAMDFPAEGHLTDERRDGRRVMTFRWNGIEPRQRESAAVPAWMDSPDFILSTGSWPAFAAEVGRRVGPLVASQPASAAKAKELAAAAKDPESGIKAIRDFVARQVRAEGPGLAGLPLASAFSPADTTLKDGYGNFDDRSILLCSMLRSAGFEADLALASWSTKEPAMQQRRVEFPSPGGFGGIVCRVKHPTTGEWLPLDVLTQYAQLGTTALDGQPGLALDGSTFTWSAPTGLEDRSESEITLDFDAAGTAVVGVTTYFRGADHAGFVQQMSEITPEDRRRMYQGMVSGIAQNAVAQGELVTDLGYPARLHFAAKVERYGVPNAGGLYFDLPSMPSAILPTDSDRRQRALLSARDDRSRTTWTVRAPAGLEPIIQPEPLDWRGPGSLGSVRFTAEKASDTDATVLRYGLDLDLHPAVVPVGNYASLLELNRRFTHPSARRVLLQPIARAAPAGSAPGSPQGEAAGRGQ